MRVEQGLPWHPVATGLAGQAIPFIVAASHAHAHALPSAPFWFPVPPPASPPLLFEFKLNDGFQGSAVHLGPWTTTKKKVLGD